MIGADAWGATAISAVRVLERLTQSGEQPPVKSTFVQE
jgi:hypothetical protein